MMANSKGFPTAIMVTPMGESREGLHLCNLASMPASAPFRQAGFIRALVAVMVDCRLSKNNIYDMAAKRANQF